VDEASFTSYAGIWKKTKTFYSSWNVEEIVQTLHSKPPMSAFCVGSSEKVTVQWKGNVYELKSNGLKCNSSFENHYHWNKTVTPIARHPANILIFLPTQLAREIWLKIVCIQPHSNHKPTDVYEFSPDMADSTNKFLLLSLFGRTLPHFLEVWHQNHMHVDLSALPG